MAEKRLQATVDESTHEKLVELAGSERRQGEYLTDLIQRTADNRQEIGIVVINDIGFSDGRDWQAMGQPYQSSGGVTRWAVPFWIDGQNKPVTGELPSGTRGHHSAAHIIASSAALAQLAAAGWRVAAGMDGIGRILMVRG